MDAEVRLDRVDTTDPHIHAGKPYRLYMVTLRAVMNADMELTISDLRMLHHALGDELLSRQQRINGT
jgi:hypothetical protein